MDLHLHRVHFLVTAFVCLFTFDVHCLLPAGCSRPVNIGFTHRPKISLCIPAIHFKFGMAERHWVRFAGGAENAGLNRPDGNAGPVKCLEISHTR